MDNKRDIHLFKQLSPLAQMTVLCGYVALRVTIREAPPPPPAARETKRCCPRMRAYVCEGDGFTDQIIGCDRSVRCYTTVSFSLSKTEANDNRDICHKSSQSKLRGFYFERKTEIQLFNRNVENRPAVKML